ncbi:MAG TPA: NAD-glutamate dehydrogenase domain-containing protein, partial [Noviherbaspirillum sp.]
QVCSAVVALYKQPRAKVFVRPDLYGRHLNVLVYLPRERYGAALVAHLARTLQDACGAREVRSHTLLADGPLARLYLIAIGADGARQDAVAAPLLEVLEGWYGGFERLVDNTPQRELRNRLRKFQSRLPADYANAVTPQAAYRDLCLLLQGEALQRARVRIETEGQGPQARAAIRLLSVSRVPPLSSMLPALHNAGIAIERERTYALDGQYFVTSLSTDGASAAKLAQPEIAEAAQELFEALFNDEAEDGRMNALAIEAGLRMRQVQLVRAYASYWRQAGCLFSLRYMAERLKIQPQHVRTLVQAFEARFSPEATAEQRAAANDTLAQFAASLSDVDHADTENILRSIAELMLATLRTSYFHEERGDTIVFKFDTQDLALLPQPRPYRELFVFARRFEGVHLRGGPVARGGLRWSDRMEDYRTEVLGLVKAQMVKNAVIVPAGAKGGFVCKMIPKDAPREVVAAEGEAVYRLFIAGLLDLTDNRVQGEIVQPARTVCYDEPDPYLVVAADKGTATFSDIANGIAVARGFWLGDAFASGGSNGYDHKKLGITARGAWESVKRHFHELGHELESEPITVVGIGDMSGDVFGNGMLRSQRIKLIAAFDHRHIFIDPDPDPAASYAERARLFALPRSSWDDYDKSLISAGGGVWPRSARSITLSPQACAALGIDAPSLSPQALMQAILCAPVDLLYNGGIGTYVKASTETQEQAKDRSNDDIRIDGNQLRCRVVAEGGNLGFTQAGRIEYALEGGHIFTDAIDNSAGVDCSDHEVNLKIWLDAEIAAQRLDASERNRLLNEATPDVVRLVLRDNALQTHLLVREAEAQHDAAQRQSYAALIEKLEGEGALSRRLEHLPDAVQLAARAERGAGLTAPELAVVIANVKNRYKRLLGPCDLRAQWWAPALLAPYFPPKLAAERDPLAHPLANAILATVLANEAVNRCGPVLLQAMADAHRVPETQVLQAWAEAWAALELAPLFATLDAHALQVPRAASVQADRDARALMKAALDGVLSLPASLRPLDAHLEDLKTLRALPAEAGQDMEAALAHGDLLPAFAHAWKEVAALAGAAGFLFAALAVQRPPGMDLAAFMRLGTSVRSESGIARLEAILDQAEATPQQAALRDHALQALRRTQQRVFARVLQSGDDAAAIAGRLAQQTAELHAAGVTVEQAALAVWRLEEVLDAQEKG